MNACLLSRRRLPWTYIAMQPVNLTGRSSRECGTFLHIKFRFTFSKDVIISCSRQSTNVLVGAYHARMCESQVSYNAVRRRRPITVFVFQSAFLANSSLSLSLDVPSDSCLLQGCWMAWAKELKHFDNIINLKTAITTLKLTFFFDCVRYRSYRSYI